MKAASTKFVPYLNITARISEAPDQGMLGAKGANYFPFVCIMDMEGEVITEFRPTSEKSLNAALELGTTYLEFQEKAKTDPKAKAAFHAMKAFNASEPPPYPEVKKLVHESGLEQTHAKLVKDGLMKVAEKLLNNINQEAQKQMRAVATDEDAQTKMQAIEKERCEKVLKLHEQGVSFPIERGIGFYVAAAHGAANRKNAALAKDLAAKAEMGIKPLLKQYDDAIEQSKGRRKKGLENRRRGIVNMLEQLKKKVAALAAPPADGQ